MFLPTFARTITFSPNHTTVVTMPIVCPCSLRLRDCWLYLVSSKVGTQYGGLHSRPVLRSESKSVLEIRSQPRGCRVVP